MNLATVPCPVCGSSDCRYVLTGMDRLHGVSGNWDLYRCPSCDTGFLHPMPTPDEITGFYPDDYYAYAPPRLPTRPAKGLKRLEFRFRQLRSDAHAQQLGYPERERTGQFMRLLVRLFPPKSDIPPYASHGILLDIGCGAGQYLLQMQHLGWMVKGIELSQPAVEAARKAGLDVTQGTLESVHVESGSVAVARLSDVLEHVPDPVALLKEIHRILQPGGRLQVTLPNLDAWTFRLFGTYWFPLEIPRHLFFFNPKSLRKLALENGFEVLSVKTWPHKEVDVIPSMQYWLREKHPRWFARLDRPGYWKLIRKAFALPKAIAHLFGRDSAMTVWLTKRDDR